MRSGARPRSSEESDLLTCNLTTTGKCPRVFSSGASHLLKWVHYEKDVRGRDLELRYFRDIDGREVDFVVTENRKPNLFVEAKWTDVDVDHGLRYLKARFPKTEAWQISASGKKDYVTPDGIHVAPALVFLSKLI